MILYKSTGGNPQCFCMMPCVMHSPYFFLPSPLFIFLLFPLFYQSHLLAHESVYACFMIKTDSIILFTFAAEGGWVQERIPIIEMSWQTCPLVFLGDMTVDFMKSVVAKSIQLCGTAHSIIRGEVLQGPFQQIFYSCCDEGFMTYILN